MPYFISFFFLILFSCLTYAMPETMYHLMINKPMGPAVADYIDRGIQHANNSQAAGIIITLDTPGGLDTSMRKIVTSILSSSIPVISFVHPSGSRASSTGTYVVYASHIAAMAPETKLGSATPVTLRSSYSNPDLKKLRLSQHDLKYINDSATYLHSLAVLYGRNGEWAKKAVKEGASLTAFEAINKQVIDYIAVDFNHLIQQISKHPILVKNNPITISDTVTIRTILPDLKTQFLSLITNPDIAYLLLLAGIYCLMFELSTPGLILPGLIGVVLLSMSFFGFYLLPLSWLGIILVIVASVCLIGELYLNSYGVLGVFGIILFFLGSIMLMEPNSLHMSVSRSLIILGTLINCLFFGLTFMTVIKSKKRSAIFGVASMVGKEGESLESFERNGQISVQGEIWNAISNEPVQKYDTVVVTAIEDQTLIIRLKKEL